MTHSVDNCERCGKESHSCKPNPFTEIMECPDCRVGMKIVVFENGSKQKLIAVVVEDDGDERELVRTDRGRDDLLNRIDDMNLSHLTVEFK